MKADIEKLLNLQNCDLNLKKIEDSLKNLPKQVEAFNEQIDAQNLILEEAKALFVGLESKRHDMRASRTLLEEKVQKFKLQLSQTKKNDEYQLIDSQINKFLSELSDMEESEIELLFQIDEYAKVLEQTKIDVAEEIKLLNKQILEAKHSYKAMQDSLADAKAKSDEASVEVSGAYLRAYSSLKKSSKRYPLVVPVKGHFCGGCNLRISNDTLSEVEAAKSPTLCEQCGRLLYID